MPEDRTDSYEQLAARIEVLRGAPSPARPPASGKQTYSYEDVAARIEAVLGVRPSTSSLRAAAAVERRSAGTKTKPRLTADMPAPLQPAARTTPARFDVETVEAWLEHHPRRRWAQALEAFEVSLREVDVDVEAAVQTARRQGLAWRQITTSLQRLQVDARSPAGIFKAYRHLERES